MGMSDEEEAEYHPNYKEGGGLFCFLSMDRECGSECMAFVAAPRNPSPDLNEQQNHCAALVGVERLGRFAGGILQTLRSTADRDRKARDDAARANHAPPPNPMGT